ncbi:HAD family hydrolase [Pseudomonas sp. QE6]|uniref:HAD family hydrolase n=1 Tax=Pseudomonas sp. QE6 TaxID=3242491 RepID=UPI003527FB1D
MASCPNEAARIQAVVFDVFGTLLRIGLRKKPYLQLMKLAREQGRKPLPDDARMLMTEELGLLGAAERLGLAVATSMLTELEHDLFTELSSVELFPDATPAIRMLQDAGVRVAACSNLAAPYAIPAKLLLPNLDAYCWSFIAGTIKPEPRIYRQVALQLGCPLDSIAMIGDTLEADCLGPRRSGIRGFHLSRSGTPDPDTFIDLTSFAQYLLSTD